MDASLRDMQRAHDQVQDEWPELVDEDCNPLQLALRLLDDSSIGEADRYPQFLALKQQFSDSLKTAVNKNYSAFNDAVGSYGIASQSLIESQETLNKIRSDLTDLGAQNGGSALLIELSSKQRQCDETLEVLEQIQLLRSNSDKIDSYVLERDYDSAEKLINQNSQIAENHGLWQLPALRSAQQYLEAQKQALYDSIVDDLSGLLYLRSGSVNGSAYDAQARSKLFSMATEEVSRAINEPLDQFISQLQDDTHNDGVTPGSVESKAFQSIAHLLGLLKSIGREQDALSLLAEHSGAEVRKYVHRTAEYIKNRYPESVRQTTDDGIVNGDLVRDLFSDLFQKGILVLQLHRAVDAIAQKDQINYNFAGIWDQLQKQLSAMMYSYIVDERLLDDAGNVDETTPFNKSLKRSAELPIVQFAQFSLSDGKGPSKELQKVLKDMFQGQVDGTESSLFIEDDSDEIFQQKRMALVPANVFNMGSIFEHFLLFINSATQIFPPQQSRVPLRLFDHFMNYVFRVQLETTLEHQYQRKAYGVDADLLRQFLYKVLDLLDTSLYYREPYVDIVLKLLQQVVQDFQYSLQEIVPPETLKQTKTSLFANWLSDEQLANVSVKLMTSTTSDDQTTLGSQELQMSMKYGKNALPMVQTRDFLDSTKFNELTQLLHTIQEILTWLPSLKREVPSSPEESMRETWQISESDVSAMHYSNGSHPYLTLSGKSVGKFDQILGSLQWMSARIKLYMRYDLRAKAVYAIGCMMSKDVWMPEYETEEVDSDIFQFNRVVMESSRILNQNLDVGTKTQIFERLPDLLDYLLVFESRRLIKINTNGIYRVFVNIRVVQQMLRSILDPHDVDFSRSLAYFALFKSTEKGIVDSIKRSKSDGLEFTIDDYKNMVRLVFSESMDRDMKKKRTSSYSAGKRYSDAIKRLDAEL